MARDFFAGATMFRSILMGLTTFLFIFGWKTGELAHLILIVSAALIACSFIRGHLLTEKVTIRVTIVLGLLSIYSLAIVIRIHKPVTVPQVFKSVVLVSLMVLGCS